ncbi:hypothetical protein Tco_0943561, partial [Tanacetum coccineum]
HPSETMVFHNEDGNPARANIKQALGYLKDGDGDGNSQHLRYQLLMGNEEGPVKKQQVIDARLRVAVETPDDFSLNYFSLKMPCAITAVGRLNQQSILIYGGTIKVYVAGGSPSSSSSIIRMDIWCIFSEYLKEFKSWPSRTAKANIDIQKDDSGTHVTSPKYEVVLCNEALSNPL